MSSRKPVIHGRDHLPGGADAIPIDPASEAALAIATFVGTQSVAGSGVATLPFNFEFYTTSTAVFGTGSGTPAPPATNASGDNALLLMQPGVYLAFATATWDSGAYDHATFVDVDATGEVVTQSGFTPMERFSVSSATLSPESIQATYVGVSPGSYAFVSLKLHNFDGSSHDVTEGMLSCMYWPIRSRSLAQVF